MPIKECFQCGAPFQGRDRQRLCSHFCSVAWRTTSKPGHGESHTKGDITTVPLYKTDVVTTVSAEDALAVLPMRWSLSKPKNGQRSYARTSQKRDGHVVTIRLQRLIMERKLGRKLLPTEIVDHKNRNTLDNTRGNLRLATSQQNRWNGDADRDNPYSFRGVHLRKNRPHSTRPFLAAITVNGKTKYLGSYPSAEMARDAYKEASLRIHGEFSPFWSNGS